MANEVTIMASLAASVGGASVSSGTLSKTLNMTGVNIQTAVQLIGYTAVNNLGEELVIAAAIGTEGYILIKNLDATNIVELSYQIGAGTDANFLASRFAQITPGGVMLFKPCYPTGFLTGPIYARALVANCNVQVWVHEQ